MDSGIENYVIKILMNRKYYKFYRDYVFKEKLPVEYKYILSSIDMYFATEEEDLSEDKLKVLIDTNYSTIKKETKDNIYNILYIISSLEDINNNIYNIIINNILKKFYTEDIINRCFQIMEDPKSDILSIEDILQQYKEKAYIISEEDNTLVSNDIEELVDKEGDNYGYEWFCDAFTNSLGKIKGGDLGLIVASPDVGKTAGCLSIATSVVKQGGKVLHINNEERGSKVKLRFLENYMGKDKHYLIQNKDECADVLEDVSDRYFLHDVVTITVSDISRLIDNYNPDLVIIDQSGKIRVREKDRNDLTLTEIYKQLRGVAKEKDTHIIGVSQSDASAFRSKYITMDAINGSKIGIQGEVDYIIGINAEYDDPTKESLRYISFPKNKLTGQNGAKVILELDKETSSYVDF